MCTEFNLCELLMLISINCICVIAIFGSTYCYWQSVITTTSNVLYYTRSGAWCPIYKKRFKDNQYYWITWVKNVCYTNKYYK